MANVKLSNVIRRAQTKVDKDDTDLVFYVGGEHIESENIRVHSRGIIVESTIGPMFYYGFKAGDFLLVSRNPHLKKAGLVDFDGICSEKTFVLETANSDVLLPEFLPFVLQNERFWDYAYRHRHGSTNTFINWSTLANYEFELPDLETQRKLAEVLWSINDTMEAYKNLISATDELVKSQFMELFGDPVTNTQGREVRPFKDFMLDIRYGTSQPPTFSEFGEFKFIRATNIKAGRITENDMLRISADEATKIEKCRLNGNEIIIVRSGANTGDTCVVTDEYRDQYAGYDIIITLNLEIANPVFFNELMNTHYMQAIIKPLTVRAAQPHINSEQVQNLPMLVVPLPEQEQFAAFVRQSDKSKFAIQCCSNLNLWSSS